MTSEYGEKRISLGDLTYIGRDMKIIAKKGPSHADFIVARANGMLENLMANNTFTPKNETAGSDKNPIQVSQKLVDVLLQMMCRLNTQEAEYASWQALSLRTEMRAYRATLRKPR